MASPTHWARRELARALRLAADLDAAGAGGPRDEVMAAVDALAPAERDRLEALSRGVHASTLADEWQAEPAGTWVEFWGRIATAVARGRAAPCEVPPAGLTTARALDRQLDEDEWAPLALARLMPVCEAPAPADPWDALLERLREWPPAEALALEVERLRDAATGEAWRGVIERAETAGLPPWDAMPPAALAALREVLRADGIEILPAGDWPPTGDWPSAFGNLPLGKVSVCGLGLSGGGADRPARVERSAGPAPSLYGDFLDALKEVPVAPIDWAVEARASWPKASAEGRLEAEAVDWYDRIYRRMDEADGGGALGHAADQLGGLLWEVFGLLPFEPHRAEDPRGVEVRRGSAGHNSRVGRVVRPGLIGKDNRTRLRALVDCE